MRPLQLSFTTEAVKTHPESSWRRQEGQVRYEQGSRKQLITQEAKLSYGTRVIQNPRG